jgi:hypothetical protein
MVVEPDGWGRPVTLSLGSLSRLDIKQGSRWRQGAATGALIGGALGGAVSLFVTALLSGLDMDPARGVAAGLASGVIIGGSTGAVVAGDRWKQVSLQDVHPLPPVRRAEIGIRLLALRF